jgi:hypothetical protein
MAKAISRKHATHRKARAHHAAKTHAHRSSTARHSAARVSRPPEIVPDPEMVGEDVMERTEIRIVEDVDPAGQEPEPRLIDDERDDESGLYGTDRGETEG